MKILVGVFDEISVPASHEILSTLTYVVSNLDCCRWSCFFFSSGDLCWCVARRQSTEEGATSQRGIG